MEVEESYTLEVLEAEERADELAAKLSQSQGDVRALQARAASNVQFERMEVRLREAIEQRDAALLQASHLDDKVNQYSSSITQLQLVIQQIQKGILLLLFLLLKYHDGNHFFHLMLMCCTFYLSDLENERQLVAGEGRRREEEAAARAKEEALECKLREQEERFVETHAALGAAGRLTEQLDLKENLVSILRRDCKYPLIVHFF